MSSTKCGMATPHFRFLATKLLIEQEVHNQPEMRCLLARYLLGTRYTLHQTKNLLYQVRWRKSCGWLVANCIFYIFLFKYNNFSVRNFIEDIVITLATSQDFQLPRSLGLLHTCISHKYVIMVLIVSVSKRYSRTPAAPPQPDLSNFTILLYSIKQNSLGPP